MLRKLNKNSGMSLIEVIVSMLVLSIAVVAVTMSFSTASKINMGTRQKQAVESLMENLLEYTEAGGTEYDTWFNAAGVTPVPTGETTQQKNVYTGIKQGMYKYDVRVLMDNDPDEYDKDKLNDYKVIQFGGTGSNTIIIDASLKSYDVNGVPGFEEGVSDYDEKVYEYFFSNHKFAVEEANLLGAVPPLIMTPMNEIPNHVDRELRLEVTKPTEDKMKLTASLTYTLDDGIDLPVGVSQTYSWPLFVSGMYDLASASEEANKLNQIYIIYSPATKEPIGHGFGQDIRIMDPEHVMKADIFIANQQDSTLDLSNEDAIKNFNGIADLDTTTHTVKVSFRKPVAGSIETLQPAGANIYCSGDVELQDNSFPTITCTDNELVAKNAEVRVVTTTLEILEAGTSKVLATKKVTHLQ